MVNERGRLTLRSVILIVAGVAIGAGMISPAVGHVTNSFTHLWRQHIRPAADARYVNVDEPAGGDLSGPHGNLQIDQGAVGSPEIAENAVTTSEIAGGAVQFGDIGVDQVGTSHLIDEQVTTSDIQDGFVLSQDIGNGQVRSPDLGPIVVRSASVVVPGGAAENGAWNVRYVTATCAPGEARIGGGAWWNSENITEELAIAASSQTPTGWRAGGANDSGVDRTLTVEALCLQP